MKKFLPILLLLLCSACTTPHREVPAASHKSEYFSNEAMNDLAIYAVSLAETPYRFGGNSPENGFDCSGFVDHVFLNSLGLKLPRTSLEISRMGMCAGVGMHVCEGGHTHSMVAWSLSV